MKIIGLTGPSGAGKSSCAAYWQANGLPAIDADRVYHSLISKTSPCTAELASAFGNSVLNSDGSINRKALAAIAFASEESTALLNDITHKFVKEQTKTLLTQYEKAGYRAVLVDAPLLFEASFDALCDFCISILAPRSSRIERIIKRDGLTQEAAEQRLNAQKCDEYYIARSRYVIINDKSTEDMLRTFSEILEKENLKLT